MIENFRNSAFGSFARNCDFILFLDRKESQQKTIVYLCLMTKNPISFILTDIEGTTTSVSFVYEILFPYFRKNIASLRGLEHLPEVQEAFEQTVALGRKHGVSLESTDQIIHQLLEWSLADKKITPLKTLQGILWEEGYKSGAIKGHVYDDVAPNLRKWKNDGIQLGVFSSGSVKAQKLIFGYSEKGDLTPTFHAYFDTKTGGKKESETYVKISTELNLNPSAILFLSDIKEELVAAENAGYQTVQLIREGTVADWKRTAANFDEIKIK
jgi:enolase-phosphatase E1